MRVDAPISIRGCFSLTYFSEWIASCNDLLSVYTSIGILKLFNSGYNSFNKTEI